MENTIYLCQFCFSSSFVVRRKNQHPVFVTCYYHQRKEKQRTSDPFLALANSFPAFLWPYRLRAADSFQIHRRKLNHIRIQLQRHGWMIYCSQHSLCIRVQRQQNKSNELRSMAWLQIVWSPHHPGCQILKITYIVSECKNQFENCLLFPTCCSHIRNGRIIGAMCNFNGEISLGTRLIVTWKRGSSICWHEICRSVAVIGNIRS